MVLSGGPINSCLSVAYTCGGHCDPWLQNKPWDVSGDHHRYEYRLVAASDGCDLIRRRLQPKITLGKGKPRHIATIEEPHRGCTAGLPISYTVGRRWGVTITRSDLKSEAIFGFLSPNYICDST